MPNTESFSRRGTAFDAATLSQQQDELLTVALWAAWSGATVLAGRSADATLENLGADNKSSGSDWVTDYDRRAEDAVRNVLTQARPHDAITGEEHGHTTVTDPSGFRWSVDPLDGTTNFIRNIPQYGTSVAVADAEGNWQVGVVAAPALGATWFAVAGVGAWRYPHCPAINIESIAGTPSLRGNPLGMLLGTKARPLSYNPQPANAALIATGFAYRADRRSFQYRALETLLAQGADVRRIGSAALDLCMVADGTLDGYAEYGTQEWDWAAGMLIAEESGAPVLRQRAINDSWSAAGSIDFNTLPSPTTPIIRDATPADYAAIGELTVAAYVEGGYLPAGHPYTENFNNAEHRAKNARVVVAELHPAGGPNDPAEPVIAGSMLITYPGQPYTEVAGDGELEFRMLAVHPDHQGHGIAKALVNYVLELAASDPAIRTVVLTSMETMTAAHQLYRTTGFSRAPERDWGIEDHTFWVFTHPVPEH
ncbi:inositol monophosphatase family protein [Micrococcoides hystricis]|uniref:inositol-phosphate phosphatase n=1 Tax=Micrococcoides hystricis TaxID=1572761 RepID=A0ABV6PB65_9MICC